METEGDGMTGNESYLAGAILIDAASVLPVIQGLVKPDDFQIEAYRTVFTAAASLAADGEPVDPVSIQARARKQGVDLSNQLLTELMEVVPTCTNAADYAHRVAEDARVRQIKELATRIQEDSVSSPDELLATLQREAEDIRGSSYRRGLLSPADTLHRFNDLVVEAGEGRDNFVPSGFPRLDEILGGGFIRSGLYILGARPAMGKSTFAVNLADNIDGNVLLVSLEMTSRATDGKARCSSDRDSCRKTAARCRDRRGLAENRRCELSAFRTGRLHQFPLRVDRATNPAIWRNPCRSCGR